MSEDDIGAAVHRIIRDSADRKFTDLKTFMDEQIDAWQSVCKENEQLKERIASLESELAAAREMIEGLSKLATQGHHYSEDCWYSCPKSMDGCCNEEKGDECDCGADRHNEKVNDLLSKYNQSKGE